jgi:hypothetical protein
MASRHRGVDDVTPEEARAAEDQQAHRALRPVMDCRRMRYAGR